MRFRLEYQMWLVCSLVAFLFILDFSFSRPSQADWNAQWEKTLEAAGKEGRLNYSQRFSGLLEVLLFDDIKEKSAWCPISLSH